MWNLGAWNQLSNHNSEWITEKNRKKLDKNFRKNLCQPYFFCPLIETRLLNSICLCLVLFLPIVGSILQTDFLFIIYCKKGGPRAHREKQIIWYKNGLIKRVPFNDDTFKKKGKNRNTVRLMLESDLCKSLLSRVCRHQKIIRSTILGVLTFANITWRKDSFPNAYLHSRVLSSPSRAKNGYGGSVVNFTPVITMDKA